MGTKHAPPTIEFLLNLPPAMFAAAYPDQDLDEVRKELERLRDAGIEVVPVCDNVDATGRCLGHEK